MPVLDGLAKRLDRKERLPSLALVQLARTRDPMGLLQLEIGKTQVGDRFLRRDGPSGG
jgi:hypothetical protein